MIDWLIWFAAGLCLLVAEVLLPGVFMMFLGLAACGTGLLALVFHAGFALQVTSFGLLTILGLAVGLRTRRHARIVHAEQEGMIGRRATALVFEGRNGRVSLGDTDWPARIPPGIAPPDPGARMRVERVDGTVVIVRPDL